MDTSEFQKLVVQKGTELYRDMAWRQDTRPYYVLVSEMMLQQTQVSRAEVKFAEFIDRFPTVEALAKASLGTVLTVWNGLGYNRRAKFLWQAAQLVVKDFDGIIPADKSELVTLPGVGENTAGAILAYAFEIPAVFIETNIRTVYLHHFFANRDDVADTEVRNIVAKTLNTENPRQWYWALMDYGAWLKSQQLGHLAQSRQYAKQSKLAGSMREMRGQILKTLTQASLGKKKLHGIFGADERFKPALDSLSAEGLIEHTSQGWRLPN